MLLTDIDSNIVYFSEWIKDFACYDSIVEKLNNHQIRNELLPYTRDYWIRDFMPIQISKTEFVQYTYNPDYLENKKYYITDPSRCCKHLNISTKKMDITLDGGNIIRCSDCIIMTDKVFVENYNLSKIQIINILENCFQCDVVFIPWDKCDIYGHADGMLRFVSHKKILLNNYINFDKSHRNKLFKALQSCFEIVELEYNTPKQTLYNWAYINYLQVGSFILLPALNIPEDELAYKRFTEIFENFQIEQVDISEIIRFGGGLNCVSWNVKDE